LFTDPPIEPYDPADHSDYELDDEIQIQNYEKYNYSKAASNRKQ
jgi:hypothetical protein